MEEEAFINFNNATIRASEIAFVRRFIEIPTKLEIVTNANAQFCIEFKNEKDAASALKKIRKAMGAGSE